ncbi:TonB-dependent receptor [Rhodanobacter sp. AS-Z3]|uniref:TonB-dependent receptor domain-containing protein n=1 Tax=Rhodanobacter sp. AS-Z3 TaxID=3031330 RepID=UPI0024791EF4|nr:TonB-dependent receptor [Rhodanobacter sp. AS-Z3]WEN15878.1 TonB-dependent receptor [Rhodanobacter sp. AS-Z3]
MSKFVQRGLQRLPLTVAVIAALQIMPVFAQDQAPAANAASQSTSSTTTDKQADKAKDAQKVKDLESVSVTGSLLKRPEYQSTSPIQVIEVKNNIAAGQFDTADFLQTTTVAAGSTQINGQFGGYIVEGGTGVQTVNLRGLGAGRTLVLLDGQRPGPAGTRGQVGAFDLNVIPQVILSRIEIVKDGSSSLYGSDALAGVVNLITRKRMDRPEVSFAASVPEHGGGEQYSASFGTGWNFSKGSVVVAAQLDKLEALSVGDRDFLSCSQDRVWGTDGQRIDRADHSVLQGSNLAGCNNLYANSIIDYFKSTKRYVPSADGSTVGPFPGYHPRPYPTKTYANSPQAYYEDQLNFPFVGSSDAISQRQRATLYGASNFSFGAVNWDTQWLFNRRESKTHSYRQFFPIVFNETDGRYYEPIMPFPSDGKETVDYFYGTTKLSGLFESTDSWSWEANAGFSRSSGDYSQLAIDARKTGDLNNAANLAATPPVSYFDPGILNGSKMSDLVGAIGTQIHGNTLYKQATANAVVTGNLFALPAGDVGAAFGAEFRHYSIDDQPSDFSKNGWLWGSTSAQVTKGSDHVTEVFSEIDVPLLKALPAIESLSLNLSGRAFKYASTPGTDNVWKMGLNWQLTPTFRLRGTLGTSFRAPGLYELYLGNQTGFQGQLAVDPCILWGDSSNDRIRANCAAAGIPADYAASGSSSATIYSGGGKGFLKPETSRAKSAGLVWTPTFANINLAVDYFDYDVRGEITQLGAGDIVFGCYGSTVYPNAFCNQLKRNSPSDAGHPNMITEIYSTYVNINRERTRGYDLQMNYSNDFSFGKLTADAQVTYTMSDTYQLFDSAAAGGFSSAEQIGYVGRPRTVGVSDLSLKRGDWTYTWQGRYVSTTKNLDLSNTYTYLGYVGAKRDIKAGWQMLNSVSATYDQPHWSLMLGVRNLFDKQPDLISPSSGTVVGNTPLYASQYDWYGRTIFARFNYKF